MRGALPYPGGWANQPLHVIAAFEAFDVAYATGKQRDWSKYTPLQLEMRAWLEGDDG